MDFLTFWGLILLAFILIPSGIIFLSYWIPKRMGHRKIGVILSLTLTILSIIGILRIVYADKLFFKSDVIEILANHDIQLKDDFKIVSNSSGGFTDYFHTFELLISDNDKQEIINKIRVSDNFSNDFENNIYLPNKIDRYSNTIIKVNYENDSEFKRESYQTFEQGYAPSHEIVTIDKKSNRLTFEQIMD